MKDIDELKRKWREIDIPAPDAPSGDGKIRREVPRSIKNRILRMQKRMLLIGILACMSAPSLLKIIELPRWFLTFYIGYFILAVISISYKSGCSTALISRRQPLLKPSVL